MIVVNNQSQVCTQATCIPALFYDFYTNENVTLLNQARLVSTRLKSKRTLTVSTTANQLNQEIEQAWIAYNLQATIPAFQNSLNAKIYSIIPYCSANNRYVMSILLFFKDILNFILTFSLVANRLFYSIGLQDNGQSYDITDFLDPADTQYNHSITSLNVLDRKTFADSLVPCTSTVSSVVIDKITSVKQVFNSLKKFK